MATPIVFDGFTTLNRGMNAGQSPSLIGQDQVAASSNFTFRNGYVHTRPPFANLLLSFDSDTTETRWSGIFQGAMFYQAEFGESGFLVSIGGRLFRIQIGLTNDITEITPVVQMLTTADFLVPAPAASVTIDVTSESPFANGDTIFIDSGQYTIGNRATKQLILIYVGGAANATVVAGTPIFDSSMVQVSEYRPNPDTFDFVYLFQAENYGIIFADQHKPIFYDGTKARQAQIGEIPPSSLGIYAWGRIWNVFPNKRTFGAGDIVYGPSGTAPLAFRDAILKYTENDFLNEGGFFAVPNNAGAITGIAVLSNLDSSLGIGPIIFGTTNSIFSVNAPVDRTTWKNLTYPIQTVSLIDNGTVGPRILASVNGDVWFRSPAGIQSFIAARRNIASWGNTPMSNEVRPILQFDTNSLLYYGSMIYFDNKLYTTVSPLRTPYGVIHNGLLVINYDEVSSIEGKTAPAWEGAVSGIQILQVVKGRIENVERAFAFVLNDSNAIELWEILKEGEGFYDQYTTRVDDQTSITRTAIQSFLETKSLSYQTGFTPKLLNMGELYIDDIVDSISLTIKFKPDQYPAWLTWGTINICANVSQCTVEAPGDFSCSVWQKHQRQYTARVLLPSPPESCNTLAGIPVNIGHEFQFRLELTGHAQIRQFRTHAIPQPQETEGTCPEEAVCKTFAACDTQWFGYKSNGT